MKCLLLCVIFVLSNYAPEEEEEGRKEGRSKSKNHSERCLIIKLHVIKPFVLGPISPSLTCYKGSGFALWAVRSAELKSNAPFLLERKNSSLSSPVIFLKQQLSVYQRGFVCFSVFKIWL